MGTGWSYFIDLCQTIRIGIKVVGGLVGAIAAYALFLFAWPYIQAAMPASTTTAAAAGPAAPTGPGVNPQFAPKTPPGQGLGTPPGFKGNAQFNQPTPGAGLGPPPGFKGDPSQFNQQAPGANAPAGAAPYGAGGSAPSTAPYGAGGSAPPAAPYGAGGSAPPAAPYGAGGSASTVPYGSGMSTAPPPPAPAGPKNGQFGR